MKIILSVCILLALTNSLYFGVSSRPLCFDIDDEKGKMIKFFYESTGETPAMMVVDLIPGDNSRPIRLSGERNDTIISADSPIRVCFSSTDAKYKSVSVEFYTDDKAHIMELAKKSQLYELHTKLIDVGENLKEITKNQQFEEQRQMIHSEIIVSHENTIKRFAVIKLIAIILIAFGQIYLLKKMLDKSSNSYNPVPSF